MASYEVLQRLSHSMGRRPGELFIKFSIIHQSSVRAHNEFVDPAGLFLHPECCRVFQSALASLHDKR